MNQNNVSIGEMLLAREHRVNRQKKLLKLYNGTVICFTLNIAGPVKCLPMSDETFAEGEKMIRRQLEIHGSTVLTEEIYSEKTGMEAYFAVKSEADKVKTWMAQIENGLAIGRLFDIDVFSSDGRKISRIDIGFQPRRCLLCGKQASVCARSRAHSVDELVRETERLMHSYFSTRLCSQVAQAAVKALLYEVSVTPKPGLIDRNHNGAHTDMDFFTMVDSTASLMQHFSKFTEKGMAWEGEPSDLLPEIRILGINAEHDMFSATNGINTHKGLIFSLGILCSAIGYLAGHHIKAKIDNILETGKQIASSSLDDFKNINRENAKTHGEKLYAFYGITGIRGEAANGFPNAKDALLQLKKIRAQGLSLNDAGVAVLLHLLANVEDTNIIARSCPEVGRKVRKMVAESIPKYRDATDLLNYAKSLDRRFVKYHLSPGGCADILAMSFFLYFWELQNPEGKLWPEPLKQNR